MVHTILYFVLCWACNVNVNGITFSWTAILPAKRSKSCSDFFDSFASFAFFVNAEKIEFRFPKKWILPNVPVLRSVVLKAPSERLYYNYKHSNSIILMALIEVAYYFIYIDVGSNGRAPDGRIFRNFSLSSLLQITYFIWKHFSWIISKEKFNTCSTHSRKCIWSIRFRIFERPIAP